MTEFHATRCDFTLLASRDGCNVPVFPLIRDWEGEETLWSLSPEHGRSYMVGETKDGRAIISKGNGLSYSQYRFLNTGELGEGTWGLLLKDDAMRDFQNGLIAESLGIKTNRMEYVIELDKTITLNATKNLQLHPVLLQYDVECPYRVSDAPFLPKSWIHKQAMRWVTDLGKNAPRHLVAAKTLIKNLSVLHSSNFLHNAISAQNYTWALELLDFEISCSTEFPYNNEEDQVKAKAAFHREVIFTYQIINYIAGVLGETIDYNIVDKLFYEYGFNLSVYHRE